MSTRSTRVRSMMHLLDDGTFIKFAYGCEQVDVRVDPRSFVST